MTTHAIDVPPSRNLAEIKRDPLVVTDNLILMDTAKFEQIQRVAGAMAQMKLMPEHLRGSAADCMMVVEQAWRWQMSPTAVASKTYSVGGKLAYEGQLVAAVVNTRGNLEDNLDYEFTGAFNAQKPEASTLECRAFATIRGKSRERDVKAKWTDGFKMSKGARDKWLSQPEQQLTYFVARVWARRHMPELLLGVYTPEELYEEQMRDVTPPPPRPVRIAPALAETETSTEEAERLNRQMDRAAAGDTLDTDEGTDPETGEVTEPAKPPAAPNWDQFLAANRIAIKRAVDLAALGLVDQAIREHKPTPPDLVAKSLAGAIGARRKELDATAISGG